MNVPLQPGAANPPGAGRLSAWARRAFVTGPDHEPPADDRHTRLTTLLSWPVRLILVAGALLIGLIWAGSPAGRQLAWALQYAALIGVSLAASAWYAILLINLGFGGAWVWLSRQPPTDHDAPAKLRALLVVTFVNRHLGHLEALGVCLVLALVGWPSLAVQLPLVAGVLLLGEPIINGLARTKKLGNPAATRASGQLSLQRRSLFYLVAFLGLVGIALLAPHQIGKLGPLFVAILVGLAARTVRFFLRKRQEKDNAAVQATRSTRARRQQAAAQYVDPILGPGVALLAIVALAGFSLFVRQRLDAAARDQRNGPPPDPSACRPEPGGPGDKPPVALFIVSDTQLHELGGRRFPGQMEVAEALVSVALRPVELDILSTATLLHFRDAYEKLGQARAAAGLAPPLWAHLGDFADLSCLGELDRAMGLLRRFRDGDRRDGRLAGVAPGNHDRSFTGNFYWSPFWDGACATRLEKEGSDLALRAGLAGELTAGARMERLPATDQPSVLGAAPSALVSVAPLGLVQHEQATRGVVGIFYDSSDTHASDFGIAGVFGAFSADQAKVIRALIDQVQALPGFKDPLFVLFGHHPFDEIGWGSRGRLEELIETLDRGGQDAKTSALTSPRVLALIASHTHRAQRRRHCVGGRQLREIIVGSTIDPPQEAAWMEIGTDGRGRAALRVRTLPSVRRPERTCGDHPGPTAARCRATIAALAAEPACRPLFSRSDGGEAPGPACADLERPLSTDQLVQGLVLHGGPDDPHDIKAVQVRRARGMLACACRGGACAVPDDPLMGEAYAGLLDAAAGKGRLEELTCLAWAASAVQAHKAAGMEMADAARCAFDDPTIQAAQETVATLEELPCP